MYEIKRMPSIGYDYMERIVSGGQAHQYLACYACFGWQLEGSCSVEDAQQPVSLRMKRERKIMNKMELTRLQRHFEACVRELRLLEQSRDGAATAVALTSGFTGLLFAAGAVFLSFRSSMLRWVSVLLSLPALACMALAYPLYSRIRRRSARRVEPLVEAKQKEIYEICQRGRSLL